MELKDVPEQVCQMTGLKDQNCAINQITGHKTLLENDLCSKLKSNQVVGDNCKFVEIHCWK